MRVLLVVYDNGSYMHNFPMGLGYISAVLEEQGYEVVVYSQDLHHTPNEHLTEYLDTQGKFDVVAISLIAGYYQYQRLLGLSEAINKAKNRPFYVLGGYGPTPEPEYFLKVSGADCVVLGEGEITTVSLFDAIARKQSLDLVPGVAWMDGGKFRQNARPPLIEDINTISQPAYHLFPIEYYRLMKLERQSSTQFSMPMMSGRGCTFKCTFCYRMDTGFRARSGESLIEEVRYLNREYGINRVSFMDDLLMTSIPRVEEICEAFEKADLDIEWDCNGRLNYSPPELLVRMRKAGCVFINFGIEAMDNTVLKNMKKGLRTDQVYAGVQATLDAGISPGLNMMFGNIGDNMDTLKKAVDFLIEYDDQAQRRTIKPVTPYPGSPLYYDAISKGLLKGPADFYENKHLNSDLLCSNFTEMSDEEVYDALKWANTELTKNYYIKEMESQLQQVEHLYETKDASFRGYRHGNARDVKAGVEKIEEKQSNAKVA
jgi:anaerobic magnesium-protoporphyrin IX monomethyl ester cyclase